MSLRTLTNQQIIDNPLYRWPRVCIHPDIWNLPKRLPNYNVGPWNEVKFDRTNIPNLAHLNQQEGVYMFIVKPNPVYNPNHSYVLYIGETQNLLQRFEKYFSYANTKHPSDQLKRRMVLVWEDFLYFQYIKTNFSSTSAREELEYDLIDTIVPPMNDKFHSKVLKGHLKSIKNI